MRDLVLCKERCGRRGERADGTWGAQTQGVPRTLDLCHRPIKISPTPNNRVDPQNMDAGRYPARWISAAVAGVPPSQKNEVVKKNMPRYRLDRNQRHHRYREATSSPSLVGNGGEGC